MNEKEKKMKEKFSKIVELPKELILNVPRITILGNEDIFIENYKGIIEYDVDMIRFTCNIAIYGEKLNVEEISADEVFITGKISNVEFE